MLKWQNTCI